MNGEDADESFLPNHYTPRLVCEQKIAWNDLYIQLSSNFWYSLTRNCLVISGDVGLVVYESMVNELNEFYDSIGLNKVLEECIPWKEEEFESLIPYAKKIRNRYTIFNT